MAVSNQSYGAFNTNLQAFLSKTGSKIFFRLEALGEGSKRLGFFFLREVEGKKPRQNYSRVSKTLACFVSMDLKKGERVEEAITFRIL